MNARYEPVHADETAHWAIAQEMAVNPVITRADGSSTLAWHAVVPPGGALSAYSLDKSDEILVLVTGRGTVSQDGEQAALRAGHCWLCPAGAERSFRNTSSTDPAILIGFWPGAADALAAGFAESAPKNTGAPVARFRRGALVHAEEVSPETMDAGRGWSISDFRLPLSRRNGSATTLFLARFLPGAVHRKHRHDRCEEIYYVVNGRGVAGAGGSHSEVRGGHFHYIPAGVEHWLVNRHDEPVDVVGIYIGAGSVEETGYVFTGDVAAAELD